MFDIGFWEIIILFGLGLVILGPERLPKVAVQIGNWAGQARRMARSLTSQIKSELDLNQPYSPPRSTKSYSRPGMDDLKPKASPDVETDDEADTDNSIYTDPDPRDHADAGADDDEPDETAKPQAS